MVVAEAYIVARPETLARNRGTTAVYSLEWLLTSPMDFIHIVNFPLYIPTKSVKQISKIIQVYPMCQSFV
jgi:hypothetical protein